MGATCRRLLKQPVAVGAGFVLASLFVAGALAPQFAPNPQTVHVWATWMNHAPMLSGWHILGTDNLGRDMLVRTLYGLHTSEQSALLATLSRVSWESCSAGSRATAAAGSTR